jgi:hypothetical protein
MAYYLLQYGKPGYVGVFRSAESLARHDRVVLQTVRGVEYGEVLLPLAEAPRVDGEVLHRPASPADTGDTDGTDLLEAANRRAEQLQLPLAFADVELTLDGIAILHAVAWAACDATAMLDELAEQFARPVRLLDLSRGPHQPESTTGCGQSGCGSGSGGCSSCGSTGCGTGSCSRGSVRSADELTAYFAQLRQQMEANRHPLN